MVEHVHARPARRFEYSNPEREPRATAAEHTRCVEDLAEVESAVIRAVMLLRPLLKKAS